MHAALFLTPFWPLADLSTLLVRVHCTFIQGQLLFLIATPSLLTLCPCPSLYLRLFFSRKPDTIPLSLSLSHPHSHCAASSSPLSICNAACTASSNCWMGAWLAEGGTSPLSACSHLTDQTSIPYDNNNPCFMTQILSDLVVPEGLDVPQNSAFQTAFL